MATNTIRRSSTGTSENAQGNFSISARPNDVLVISATNFGNVEVPVTDQNNVSVRLSRAQVTLSEVVVTGAYNTKRTARSTSYNAQMVTGEQLNVIRQTNLNNALAGKISGLQVRSQSVAALGRNTNIRLRGASGLGGDEGIIYVVDGTILPNADDINMDDVADITFLQGLDASP